MKKYLLVPLLVIWLLVACTPSAPATPVPTATPLDLATIPAGIRFAGMLQGNVPYNIVWYDVDNVPSDSNVTAALRSDGGIDLKVDGISMPIWSDNGQLVMSDNVNGSIVDFASGSLGAAGIKDGTIVYIRKIDGNWQVGLKK